MLCGKTKKEIYIPNYYREFHCIADRCKHSCCIDWEICIDEKTLSKYRSLESVMDTVTESEDGACFTLCKDGRCPHLNEAGLCKLILSYGEAYLSDICRNHPRFFLDMGNERLEVGLGIGCEEACRLILESEKPFTLSKAETSFENIIPEDFYEESDRPFDPIPQRAHILALIAESGKSFHEKLTDLNDIFALPSIRISDEWLERFLNLEILDASWISTLQAAKETTPRADGKAYDKYYERLLSYFVFRHTSIAECTDELRARLSFAILSVEMIKYLFERESSPSLEKLIDLARRYSAEIEYSEDNTDELIFAFENNFPLS